MKKILTLLLAFTALTAYSQNTLSYTEETEPAKAKIADAAWIAGTWQGNAIEGWCEEIWSKPQGGSMMFSFRMMKDGQVIFYELGHIVERDGSLVLELKHFDASLTGWEEKDAKEIFRLVKVEKDKLYFDGFTIHRKSPDNIIMYVLMDDTGKELAFDYKRAK